MPLYANREATVASCVEGDEWEGDLNARPRNKTTSSFGRSRKKRPKKKSLGGRFSSRGGLSASGNAASIEGKKKSPCYHPLKEKERMVPLRTKKERAVQTSFGGQRKRLRVKPLLTSEKNTKTPQTEHLVESRSGERHDVNVRDTSIQGKTPRWDRVGCQSEVQAV